MPDVVLVQIRSKNPRSDHLLDGIFILFLASVRVGSHPETMKRAVIAQTVPYLLPAAAHALKAMLPYNLN